jgi:mRNA interferase RelE/StbE
MYELYIRRRAEKFLNHTDPSDRDRIVKAILELAENPRPHGCEKLIDDIYRIRVGPYRVIYLIDDTTRELDIGKVDRRKERTYKDLRTLFR